MLVKELSPGELVEARGWDVAVSKGSGVAWLVPHGMNHKKSLELGYKSVLFYVGPTRVQVGDKLRKMHNFLTEEGSSVFLEGCEFRYLNPCTS